MRHQAFACVCATALLGCPLALAADATSLAPSARAMPTSDARAGRGLVVVAQAGASDIAWPLAREVYGKAALRPAALVESDARILAGEPAADQALPTQRDLAEMVAAVRDEAAASRAVLAEIARRFAVRAIVVVHVEETRPVARVFLPETGGFDAASYAPQAGSASWSGAVASLERNFGPAPPRGEAHAAPALSMRPLPAQEKATASHAFYESGWFWAAVGGAALLGGSIYLATRDSGSPTIHLEVQVPHQ